MGQHIGRADRARRREGLLRQEERPHAAAARDRREPRSVQRSSSCLHTARGSAAMKDSPRGHEFDWTLMAIVGAICGIGVLEIYSSTHASGMAGLQWKQVMWIAVGLAGMFVISRIDYHTLMDQ